MDSNLSLTRPRCLVLILALALFPSTALANAGTPLMWASMFHLVVGNAIIGMIEALILGSVFKCPAGRVVPVIIAANYASAWLGAVLLAGRLRSLADITIENIQPWVAGFAAITFVVTLVIEFPFFWWALRPGERPLRNAVLATPLVHGISYALLIALYWAASGTSMLTQLEVVPASELKLSKPYSLCFLTSTGDDVVKVNLNDLRSGPVIATLEADHHNDRLFARRRGDLSFDLFAYLASDERDGGREVLIAESFFTLAPVEEEIAERHSDSIQGTWFNFGPVPSIASGSAWEFRTGFWASEGLRGQNQETNEKVRFALEVPFAAWPVRNATHLEGGYVVFQLGKDQICLLHADSRRLALITRGRGPVVGIIKER
jgi:hypothetical protein